MNNAIAFENVMAGLNIQDRTIDHVCVAQREMYFDASFTRGPQNDGRLTDRISQAACRQSDVFLLLMDIPIPVCRWNIQKFLLVQ